MRSHRLNRLTLLTQGIALVGFGMSELACGNKPTVNGPAPEEPHINAPPTPEPAHVNAMPTPGPSASGSGSATPSAPKPPIHTNAPNPNAK
jgi:hypothetical protein